MTVAGFLRYVARLRGLSAERTEARLREVLKLADLEDRADQVIGTLSHGYRKRVGIAQAVIHDPRLVILDEPISGLDPRQIIEMRNVVRRLGQGRAVLISSHILSEISQTCSRILVVHDGKITANGTEDELVKGLGGEARLVITVRGEQAAFEAFLAKSAHCQKVVTRQIQPPYASAVVSLDGDVREALLASIVQAGFGLRLVEVPDDELEEIFLGLTREQVPQ